MPSPTESPLFQATLDGKPVDGAVRSTGVNYYNLGENLLMFHDDDAIGLRDSRCEINVYRTKVKLHCFEEPYFFKEYRRLLFESVIVSSLVRFLTDEISGSTYYFDGDDPDALQAVEEFWFENDLYAELEEVCQQAVLMGTGVGVLEDEGGEMGGFRRVDVQSIDLKRNRDTGDIKIEQSIGGKSSDITDDAFFLRLFKFPDTPWGISLVRAALTGIQGLEDLLRDIPPAIKQLAYVDRILKLDLEDVNDPNEKKKIMQNARDAFAEYDAASTTVVVMDQENELGYMGTVGNSGGGQKRIDPILPAIEPILMFILFNFHIAPGEIVQQGANQSIIQEQRVLAKKRIENLRKKFAREVEKQIIAPLLGEEGVPSVRIRYEPDPLPPKDEANVLRQEYEMDVISRQEFRRRRGFRGEPEGKLFSDTAAAIRKQLSIQAERDLTETEEEAVERVQETSDSGEAGEDNDD